MSDLTRDMIVDGLRDLGLRPGDLVVAHSSYKSFGLPVAGGPRAVAEALIDAVSPGGSVFVPAFNYGQLPYAPVTTPSLDGAVSEAFRQLPGVTRSPHPTHPLAGIGPDARD